MLAVDRRATSTAAPGSLSPAALRRAPFTPRLVLPSPNGSAIAAAAHQSLVVAGCLRNATATARWLAERGLGNTDRPVTVIAAGERWPDGSLRPRWKTCSAPARSSPHSTTCGPVLSHPKPPPPAPATPRSVTSPLRSPSAHPASNWPVAASPTTSPSPPRSTTATPCPSSSTAPSPPPALEPRTAAELPDRSGFPFPPRSALSVSRPVSGFVPPSRCGLVRHPVGELGRGQPVARQHPVTQVAKNSDFHENTNFVGAKWEQRYVRNRAQPH